MNYNLVRIWFKKDEESRFLSHLDINKCFTRALSASGLPFWYTEGFNPHLFLAFPSPLALGIIGENECFDVKLPSNTNLSLENSKIDDINRFLPRGLEILNFSIPVMKGNENCYSEFEIKTGCDTESQKFENFFEQKEIFAEKKTKTGIKILNLKDNIKKVGLTKDGRFVILKIILTTGKLENVNPFLLVNALEKYLEKNLWITITRKCCYDEKLQIFV